MTKLQNVFTALVNMDIFQITLKLLLTNKCNFCCNIFVYARHAECLQMYAVSAPFELLLNFP